MMTDLLASFPLVGDATSTAATWVLSLIVFLPALGALAVACLPRERGDAAKLLSLAVTIAVFLLTVWIAIPGTGAEGSVQFQLGEAAKSLQNVFSHEWIPSFNIYYFMGLDGISFSLLILTSFLSVLAMGASWNITKHVKAYCVLFLLLETGMLGVFLALDFILFYVFWEVMLLPMYFLVGVWGGERRQYAAIKFFLYTLMGSVLMLIAILVLYYHGDLVKLARTPGFEPPTAEALAAGKWDKSAWDTLQLNPRETRAVREALDAGDPKPIHTFNVIALAKMAQHTPATGNPDLVIFPRNVQWWCFLLLFIGFAIKVPVVPVHTWLPDAHVEAPTPISMILAGVLLKMGGYGIIRMCYPICPDGGFELRWLVCLIGVVSMIYGALAALAQKDFKRLVAYSSVSHMGYVVLGLGVWSAVAGTLYDADYWSMGMNGAMFQMIAHGISSAGMFFMVGIVYDRVHHRNIDQFGGLFGKMPVYSGIAFGIFFAGLGLPGLCGFWGEVFVTLSAWKFSPVLAVISAFTVILTAGYILWTLQRVYLGAEYKGPHGDHLTPITPRELAIAAPLLALAILFGVYPRAALDYMAPSVQQTAEDLAAWRKLFPEPVENSAVAEPGVTQRDGARAESLAAE